MKKDPICYVDDVLEKQGKSRLYDEKIRRFAPIAKSKAICLLLKSENHIWKNLFKNV